jgi:hypothetical protein
MHTDDGIPFLNAHIEEHTVTQDAGHMDDDVDLAKRVQRSLDDGLSTFWRRYRVIVRCCRAAGSSDLFDDRISGRMCTSRAVNGNAQVIHHDFRTLQGEEFTHLASDPIPTASHYCYFVL